MTQVKVALGVLTLSIVVASVYWWYTKSDEEQENKPIDKANDDVALSTDSTSKITKDELKLILRDIIAYQDQVKCLMKNLTRDLLKGNNGSSLQDAYKTVRNIQPEDPLDKCKLSMAAFEMLLDRHQHDPEIREVIGEIMGAPTPSNVSSSAQQLTVKKLIAIHEYMLQELTSLVQEFSHWTNPADWDLKTVTLAAQALVGARVEARFGVASDDIEAAVLLRQEQLTVDSEFSRISVQMQTAMSQLIGTHTDRL